MNLSDIKIGDTVLVTAPWPSFLDWKANWQPGMDAMIGKTFVVTRLLNPSRNCVGKCPYGCYYPPQILRLASANHTPASLVEPTPEYIEYLKSQGKEYPE